jgi:hypothetical protein
MMDFADDKISAGKQENTNFFEGLRKTVMVRGEIGWFVDRET